MEELGVLKSVTIAAVLPVSVSNSSVNLTGADRGELENAGASEKLIDAIIHPASIGPEVTPEAARAAARESAASQRPRR